ncbi:GMP synthase [glutamine-hydrolyzing] subunit A [Cyberlindnera fabianii]|uniref:GMP synthase [glutamine-hydrolyzing] subunit A n=1 Tax=Cyberlindnera fabianii TaxID=36022 RepID=A0A1V2L3A4_CYBFA|nr:GMP synthase [glutamine-hydrolyzing] subunit A [Cyberlindnera fabianii]
MTKDAPTKYVAIYKTDYTLKLKDKLGDLADISVTALKDGGLKRPIKVFDVIKGHFPTNLQLKEEVKAIWITGSSSDAFADEEWINNLAHHLEYLIRNHPHIRIIGICFGHQIVSRSMGAKVFRNPKGWEAGVYDVNVNVEDEDIKELFSEIGETIRIQEVHQDCAFSLPKGFKNIGSTDKTEIQGMYLKRQVLTFQGHPEIESEYMHALIEMIIPEHPEFTKEFIDDTRARAKEPHNGKELNQICVKFIES